MYEGAAGFSSPSGSLQYPFVHQELIGSLVTESIPSSSFGRIMTLRRWRLSACVGMGSGNYVFMSADIDPYRHQRERQTQVPTFLKRHGGIARK
jgi:hypothetical protein